MRVVVDAKGREKFQAPPKIKFHPQLKYSAVATLSVVAGWELSTTTEELSMHIAQIAPLTEAIPPKLYGGTERVVSWLTEELIALGHEVTLFASGDSVTSARLEAVWPRALRLDGAVRDPNALHMMMLERVYQRSNEFDFLHCHLDYYPFSLFSRQATPFVTTLHGRLDLPEHQPMFDTFSSVPVVSISNSQRRPVPQANWIRTVQHGLPIHLLDPMPVKPSYFAFLGRIAPEKGIDRAIRIAQHCGVTLKVAAKVDSADRDYYDEQIKPLIKSNNVEFIGEIGDKEKPEFLSGAMVLLVPIDWPEPFGLVMIEAMACGTPVIAFNRGSVPEIIEDGLTGYIVEDINGAIGAVDRLGQLSREGIRRRFEERFTSRRMAQDYLAVYRSLSDSASPHLRLVTQDAPAL
jgi:glycosyltransferase involved in cell wall biosynthesis